MSTTFTDHYIVPNSPPRYYSDMQEMIDRLREKPSHHRQLVAFGTAATVTAMIALIWVVTMAGRFGGFEGTPASAGTAAEESGLSISAGRAMLEQSFEQAQQQFQGISGLKQELQPPVSE